MTEIKDYSSIKVDLISSTVDADCILETAINMTMKQDYSATGIGLPGRIQRLIEMGHTSLFEHINYTFLIEGASRNFLSQMTRHRMASYTSGSQHYQIYSDYDFTISSELKDIVAIKDHIDRSMFLYEDLIRQGFPREEARQILPGGMQNNLMVTINARSLMNFFRLRLCRRNVQEMQVVAKKMYNLCYIQHPYIWVNIGPECYKGQCKQGKMNCGKGKMTIDELLTD